MPQRFLRPGIRNSERWNSVCWRSQAFYVRLLTLVDDYGRYDGRPSVLWGECFAVWNEKHPAEQVTLSDTCRMLRELAASPWHLIDLYESGGKQVLQITQWEERIRDGTKERWPKNPNPQQVAASCRDLLPPSPPPSPPPSYVGAGAPAPKFQKPTQEQVKLWMAKAGLPESEADKFWDHYESNGWKVGRVPMKSLDATLRKWKRTYQSKTYATAGTPNRQAPDRNAGTYNQPKGEYAEYVRRQEQERMGKVA